MLLSFFNISENTWCSYDEGSKERNSTKKKKKNQVTALKCDTPSMALLVYFILARTSRVL
jgi:hypothetical protein